MSGFQVLRPITEPCCAARYAAWRFRIWRGLASDSLWFSCAACGRHYTWRLGGWEPVSAAESLADMVAHDPRGTLEIET